ncbi:MAG: ribosome-associated translation inhibitor RaiA [Candidatus Paceibacterota bacterium]|jgi:putative sigma-54 modulation protein
MRIEINAVHLELTEALKKYIETKIKSVERMIKKFEVHGELIAFVEISRTTRHHRQGDIYYAEITMKLPQKTIRIEKTHEDVYGAIDELKDLLKEEVSELKEINKDKTKKK